MPQSRTRSLRYAPTTAWYANGVTQVTWTVEKGETKSLICVADRDGQIWLRGESVLSAAARWREDFEEFLVDVDLNTWEWPVARQLQQSVAVSP